MIVMTGANGRLGRMVTHSLARAGKTGEVTLATRDPRKIADLAEMGFSTTRCDFDDPASLREAFTGADTLLLISIPGPVKERIPRHRNAFDAARDAGVGRVVYTSRVNPSWDSRYPFAEIHAFSEDYLRSTGLTTTIVRNNEYCENAIGYIRSAPAKDDLVLPGATGKVAYVAVNDVADVLATVMTEDGHEGKIYNINGSEAATRDEIAQTVAEATGHPARARPVDAQQFSDFMKGLGRPPFIYEMVKGLQAAIDAGEFGTVYPDTARILGRPAKSIHECVREAVRSGIIPS